MNRIAVFARWPETGRVKTRLSPALPPALACQLYRAMLADTVLVAGGPHAHRVFWYWADAPEARSGFALPPAFEVFDQRGADLGVRLERAFAELLRSPGDRAVVIGADCPALGRTHLRAAFEALAAHDLVLGPARDGGYYLVGLRRTTPEVFRGIAWGTAHVFAETLERARVLALRTVQLDALDDLDTPEDLVRLIAREVESPGALSRLMTGETLRRWGLLPGVG